LIDLSEKIIIYTKRTQSINNHINLLSIFKTNNVIIDQNTEKSDLTNQANRRWTFERKKKFTLWTLERPTTLVDKISIDSKINVDN